VSRAQSQRGRRLGFGFGQAKAGEEFEAMLAK
jgi:hypothetical protein